MSRILRVTDSVRGRPAAELPVRLDRYDGDTWRAVDEGATGGAGEAALAADGPGLYRVRAAAAQYFDTRFPEIQVIFDFAPGQRVELQLAPAGYSVQVLTP
jgi:5-hydroxyisourate hydrolase